MQDLKSGLFFLAFAIVAIAGSLRAGLGTASQPGSGFVSFCAGLILAAFSLVLLKRGRPAERERVGHAPAVTLALASLFAYSLILDSLGFIPATFLLVIVLLRLGRKRPWWALLSFAAVITFFVHLVFATGLHVYFPRGFLGL